MWILFVFLFILIICLELGDIYGVLGRVILDIGVFVIRLIRIWVVIRLLGLLVGLYLIRMCFFVFKEKNKDCIMYFKVII